MRKIYQTVPFKQFAQKDFERREFMNDFANRRSNFHQDLTLIFGSGRTIRQFEGYDQNFFATVENPSYDTSSKLVEKYMTTHDVSGIVQKGESHMATVKDGVARFEPLVDGCSLNRCGGVGYATLKRTKNVRKQAKEWSETAKALGFETHMPKTVPMVNDCEAIKLCVNYITLGEDDVVPYVTGKMLKAVPETNSNLSLNCETSSLVIDSKAMTLTTKEAARGRHRELPFALSMMGDFKEPHVRYPSYVDTRWDAVATFYRANKDAIFYTFIPVVAAGVSAAIGYAAGENTLGILKDSGFGAGIGLAGDAIVGGIPHLVGSIKGWRNSRAEKREEIRSRFGEFSSQLDHLKDPYGFCVAISTDKCASKIPEKKKEIKE